MGLNTVLVTLAGLSIAADVGVVTSPSASISLTVPSLSSVTFGNQKRGNTSVQFSSAHITEVLKWLRDNGYNFVVNDNDLPKNRTITLNIKDLPVSAVADAIAKSLDGHWETTNGIRVFKKGTLMKNWMAVPSEGNLIWGGAVPGDVQLQEKIAKELQDAFGPKFQKQMEDMARSQKLNAEDQELKARKLQEMFGSDFEKQMQDAFGPKFQKQMEEMARSQKFNAEEQELKARKLQEMFGSDFEKKMQDAFGPKFQKQMEEMERSQKFNAEEQELKARKLQEMFGSDFEKKMQDAFGPKFQKQMEEMAQSQKRDAEVQEKMAKSLQDQLGADYQNKLKQEIKQALKDKKGMLNFQLNQKLLLDEKVNRPGGSDSKAHSWMIPPHSSENGSSFDAIRFMNMLTPDEKDQQKKQGFVWFNDLSSDQKKMFAGFSGKFEIFLKISGEEIRVKRN